MDFLKLVFDRSAKQGPPTPRKSAEELMGALVQQMTWAALAAQGKLQMSFHPNKEVRLGTPEMIARYDEHDRIPSTSCTIRSTRTTSIMGEPPVLEPILSIRPHGKYSVILTSHDKDDVQHFMRGQGGPARSVRRHVSKTVGAPEIENALKMIDDFSTRNGGNVVKPAPAGQTLALTA